MVGTNSHKYDANDYVWMKSDEKGKTAAPGSFSSFTDKYRWKITDQSTSSTAVPFANIDPEMCYGWKGTCLGVDVDGNLETRPCQERTYQQTWKHFDEYTYDINTCSTALELVTIPSGTVGDCSKSICYKFEGEFEACDASETKPLELREAGIIPRGDPNFHKGMRGMDTFHCFVRADMLVCDKSTFSTSAAILSRGIVYDRNSRNGLSSYEKWR